MNQNTSGVYAVRCSGCFRNFFSFDQRQNRCDWCRANDRYRERGKRSPFEDLEDFLRKTGRMRDDVMPQVPAEPAIPPEMLRRLIMLCHPDRHNNSEMSRIATDWLLKQKEKQK